mmetsp:Transcript_26015/g.35844  ORF Transcript_26015/g.35844 Transcript_26015/m.35844 type:complete len:230 (-) Transcript_26015:952-1641(-)
MPGGSSCRQKRSQRGTPSSPGEGRPVGAGAAEGLEGEGGSEQASYSEKGRSGSSARSWASDRATSPRGSELMRCRLCSSMRATAGEAASLAPPCCSSRNSCWSCERCSGSSATGSSSSAAASSRRLCSRASRDRSEHRRKTHWPSLNCSAAACQSGWMVSGCAAVLPTRRSQEGDRSASPSGTQLNTFPKGLLRCTVSILSRFSARCSATYTAGSSASSPATGEAQLEV